MSTLSQNPYHLLVLASNHSPHHIPPPLFPTHLPDYPPSPHFLPRPTASYSQGAEMPWGWLDPSSEPVLLVQPILPPKATSSALAAASNAGGQEKEAALVLQAAARRRFSRASAASPAATAQQWRVGEGVEISAASVGVLPSLMAGGEQVHAALELRKGVKLLRFGSTPFVRPAPLPPSWLLKVKILSATGLRASDFGVHGFTSDPFVEVSLPGSSCLPISNVCSLSSLLPLSSLPLSSLPRSSLLLLTAMASIRPVNTRSCVEGSGESPRLCVAHSTLRGTR